VIFYFHTLLLTVFKSISLLLLFTFHTHRLVVVVRMVVVVEEEVVLHMVLELAQGLAQPS